MMGSKWIVFLLIISNTAWSSIPTVEGLFRNGSNPAQTGDTVALNITFEEEVPSTEMKETSIQITQEDKKVEEAEKSELALSHYKLIFGLTTGQPLKAIQVRYLSASMDSHEVLDVKNFENMNATLAQESSFEKLIAYSFVLMFALNDSSGFNEFLKRYGRGFVPNQEMINKEKVEIYERYKEYLATEQEGPSPIEPETEEEKEKVSEVLSAPFYKGERKATLVRSGPKFLWEVNLDTLRAQFDHTKGQLVKMTVATFEGEVQIDVGPYTAVNGEYEIPTFVLLRYDTGKRVKINLSGYQDFNSRNKKLHDRFSDYQKLQEQSQKKIDESLLTTLTPSRFMY